MNSTRTYNEWYDEYMDFRRAFSFKKPANDFVRCFLNWCARTCPGQTGLAQDLLDAWCAKRDTENGNSHGRRVSAINHFLDFVNERGDGPYRLGEYTWDDPGPEPELFSAHELANFFRAVDEIPDVGEYRHNVPGRLVHLRALEAPVAFRLLYSTGMRVNELRWLHRSDVDLENGIIYIRRTKGYDERIIALHPSMTELLRVYMKKIAKEVPSSHVLFPQENGEYHNSAWIRINFKRCWYKYNPKPADGRRDIVAYSLRHNYAVENIMAWHQDGYNADKRMVALSKSMGHRSIKATQYYFHLVPRFADLLDSFEGDSVADMLPNLDEE